MNRRFLIKKNAIAVVLFILTFSSIANAQLGDLLNALKGLGAELEKAGSQKPSAPSTATPPTNQGLRVQTDDKSDSSKSTDTTDTQVPYKLIMVDLYGHPRGSKLLGFVSSEEEMCKILKHPFFKNKAETLKNIGFPTVDGYIQLPNEKLAREHLREHTSREGISSWTPLKETEEIINERLSRCLNVLTSQSPNTYEALKSYFLHYLDTDNSRVCFKNSRNIKCVRFEDTLTSNHFNALFFLIHLTLKEGNKTLVTMLENGETKVAALTEEYNQKVAQDEARKIASQKAKQQEQVAQHEAREIASQKAKQQEQQEQQRRQQRQVGFGNWAQYSKREKTIVEQTLNYSTCGNTDGSEGCHWRKSDSDACVARRFPPESNLDNVNNTINIRNFNQTAFRILKPILGEPTIEYTDGAIKIFGIFYGNSPPLMDRVKNAWGITFKQCPGKKSAF